MSNSFDLRPARPRLELARPTTTPVLVILPGSCSHLLRILRGAGVGAIAQSIPSLDSFVNIAFGFKADLTSLWLHGKHHIRALIDRLFGDVRLHRVEQSKYFVEPADVLVSPADAQDVRANRHDA